MSAWKKFTAFLMSVFLLLTTGAQAFAGTSMEDALNKVNLYVKQDKGAQLLTWKGIIDSNNFAPAIIVYQAEDGKEYPAFCANPNRPGVEDLAFTGAYVVLLMDGALGSTTLAPYSES